MGGIFGGGSSQPVQPVGQSTTIQKSEPWEGQKGFLTDVYNRANDLSKTAPSYYPGSTVTPFSQQTEDALNSVEGRARTGSGLQAAGNQQMLNTAQGGYLNPTPWLNTSTGGVGQNEFGVPIRPDERGYGPYDPNVSGPYPGSGGSAPSNTGQPSQRNAPYDASDVVATARGERLSPFNNPYLSDTYNAAVRPMVENYRDSISPGIDAHFAKAGRYGSGLYKDMKARSETELARGMGDVATGIYGQNFQAERGRQDTAGQFLSGLSQQGYQAERGRQQEAIRGAPEYAAKDYQDAQALLGIGGQREAQGSMQLQDLVNRYNFDQQAPWANLGNYSSLVQGDYGRTQTNTQPIYQSQKPSGLETLIGGAGSLGLLGIGAKRLFG